MSDDHDPLGPAVRTAQQWLHTVARHLDTDDEHLAHRMLRAWLHTVRDSLGVNSTAHLGAQLPGVLRGEFFDGWVPEHTPRRADAADFANRFAHAALIDVAAAPATAVAVTQALRELFSPGQLDKVLATFPRSLRVVLDPGNGTLGTESSEARIDELETRLYTLFDAVLTLAHGLAESPIIEPTAERSANAARQVQHLLLANHP